MILTLAQLGNNVDPPLPGYAGNSAGFFQIGLPSFINSLVLLTTIVGGLLLLFNVILAGFEFSSAAGDPKKIENAWTKIWQSLVGLITIVSFIIIAGIINKVVFGGTINILEPKITGPGTP